MDLLHIDWNTCMDQMVTGCHEILHWMLNDGSSFSLFLGFVVLCCVVVAFAARGRGKELSQGRAGYDVECFVRDLTGAGHDGGIARLVYHYIQDMHRVEFPILPQDDLYTMLGISEEAVRQAMPALMEITGRQDRRGNRLRKPLNTVADLVGYVENLPRALDYVWEMQTA